MAIFTVLCLNNEFEYYDFRQPIPPESGIPHVKAGPPPGENNVLRRVDDPGVTFYEN